MLLSVCLLLLNGAVLRSAAWRVGSGPLPFTSESCSSGWTHGVCSSRRLSLGPGRRRLGNLPKTKGRSWSLKCQERQTDQEVSVFCFLAAEGPPLRSPLLGLEVLARAQAAWLGPSEKGPCSHSVQNPITAGVGEGSRIPHEQQTSPLLV